MSTPNSTTDEKSAALNQGAAEPNAAKPSRNPPDWSGQLTDRFGIEFDEELKSWWDEISQLSNASSEAGSSDSGSSENSSQGIGSGEFRYPATPQTLLSSVPDPIWPPLMPPNFLPLIGNGAGDWLCLRLLDPEVAAKTGVSSDVCHWYHGGGDWLPWGGRLSEALLFDATLAHLPQSERRHAEPATDGQSSGSPDPPLLDWFERPWGRWVSERLPGAMQIDWKNTSDPHRLANAMLDQGLCDVPVRCQLAIDALSTKLTEKISPIVAQDLGLIWNDLMRWCFDLRTMPSEVAQRLQSGLGLSPSCFDPDQQRWDEVARHALDVCGSHADLAWSHDLLGYVRWRDGHYAEAKQAFEHSIRCSVFTDQSVRLRTHWATSSEGVAKFSAWFLESTDITSEPAADVTSGSESGQELSDQLGRLPHTIGRTSLLEYLGRHARDEASSVRQRYSQMLVDAAGQEQAPATRARLLYSAGWDLGAEPLRRYGELLDQYLQACHDAGWATHHQLATVHRQGLKSRYNL